MDVHARGRRSWYPERGVRERRIVRRGRNRYRHDHANRRACRLWHSGPDDWKAGEVGEFGDIFFGPELSLRYTAPSLGDLGCADHPGETFRGHVGVLADFKGDAGTLAHVDPLLGGQGWVGAAVPLGVTCPLAESTATPADLADLTPPPTDALPASAAPEGAPPLWALLAVLVVVGVAVVACSGFGGSRIRRSQ